MSEKHIKEKQNPHKSWKNHLLFWENKLMRVIKGDAEAMFFLLFFVFIIYLQILDSFVSRLDEVVGHFAVFCRALFFLKV